MPMLLLLASNFILHPASTCCGAAIRSEARSSSLAITLAVIFTGTPHLARLTCVCVCACAHARLFVAVFLAKL